MNRQEGRRGYFLQITNKFEFETVSETQTKMVHTEVFAGLIGPIALHMLAGGRKGVTANLEKMDVKMKAKFGGN
jgi:hypothetical protein